MKKTFRIVVTNPRTNEAIRTRTVSGVRKANAEYYRMIQAAARTGMLIDMKEVIV